MKSLIEKTITLQLEKDLVAETLDIIEREDELIIQVTFQDKIKATLYVLEVYWESEKLESVKTPKISLNIILFFLEK